MRFGLRGLQEFGSSAVDRSAMPEQPKFRAVAHPNIALIKYWGKVDHDLIIPATSSLSLTLDIFPTTTTLHLDPTATTDQVVLNGQPAGDKFADRVTKFLDLLRARTGNTARAVVDTVNAGPTGAGLASSAAGFAALAGAAAAAWGQNLNDEDLSRLARRGSGSASRSIYAGLAQWDAGDSDETSVARPVAADVDLALVVVVVDAGEKAISSRAAMANTELTSPYYQGWVTQSKLDLVEARSALAAGDVNGLGAVVEANAMRMHASMLASFPPIRYLNSNSVAALDQVAALRAQGLVAWATMDAGPNVKVLTTAAQAQQVAAGMAGFGQVLVAHSGPGLKVTQVGK